MNWGFPHASSGWLLQGAGQNGSPSTKSAVPTFIELTEKRSRSTPVGASAQPSATSPAATVAPNSTLMSDTAAVMSGSPPDSGTHVHCAVHWPLAHPAASAPSHGSEPSRIPFPQMLGAVTLSVNTPLRPPYPSATM